MSDERTFQTLVEYLALVPSIKEPIGYGEGDTSGWWVKFAIDIDHPVAWRVVQELGHVLNYLSINERLPTVFKPVSPPPYMNGGPKDFLSWVIECSEQNFRPGTLAKWLDGRLPQPVADLKQWKTDE